jgi:hypothetical protein
MIYCHRLEMVISANSASSFCDDTLFCVLSGIALVMVFIVVTAGVVLALLRPITENDILNEIRSAKAITSSDKQPTP